MLAGTLVAVQDSVRSYVAQPANVTGALQGRAIEPPVHFDIGFSTSALIDEPVVGFGNDVAGGATASAAESDGLPPAASDTGATAGKGAR